jgi:hypothetical protein
MRAAAAVGFAVAFLAIGQVTASATRSPVTKVVELIEELKAKIEADAISEQKIYDKWFDPGPTNINMPISSNLKVAFEVQALPY